MTHKDFMMAETERLDTKVTKFEESQEKIKTKLRREYRQIKTLYSEFRASKGED